MEPTDGKPARPEPPEDSPSPEDDLHLSSDVERAAAVASVIRDQALKRAALARMRPLGTGPPSSPGTGGVVALSVVTDNEHLGSCVQDLLGRNVPHFLNGTTYSFVVDTY